jgi:antitoxin HicB
MKYTYPIVITHEPDASTKAPQYIVRIPDFDALTQGESITDAIEMGQDLLSILVVQYEDEKRELPEVSSFTDLSEQFSGSVVSLVIADSDHYRQMYQSKPVKKTLTIPSWLNSRAEEAGINFSQTLQDALKAKLL